jgi:hypothetical protein
VQTIRPDEISDETFDNRGSPISTATANLEIFRLMKLVPTRGTRFGITKSFIHSSVGTTISEDDSWRIDVTLEVPRRPTLLFANLASWGLKAATRKIQFVVRADQIQRTAGSDGTEASPSQLYTLLNGDFPNQLFSQIEPKPREFRDEELADLYGAVYATTNFDDVLKVIRSEFTGEKAFEES